MIKWHGNIRRLVIASVLAVSSIVAFASPALAIDTPDSLVLDSIYAYRNVLETSDQLYIIHYHINYTVKPSESANTAFFIRFLDGTTELANTTPYPYFEDGYYGGAASIYFDASDPNIPTWSDPYTIQLTCNPFMVWNPSFLYTDSPITAWSTATTTAATRLEIASRIIAISSALGIEWNYDLIVLLEGSYYLTTDIGQPYFTAIIDNLALAAPSIIQSESQAPIYKTTPPSITYAPDLLLDKLDVTNAAAKFGMSKSLFSTFLMLGGLVVFIVGMIARNNKSGKFAFIIAMPIILFGARIGGISMTIISIIGIASLFLVFYTLFYEKSPQ